MSVRYILDTDHVTLHQRNALQVITKIKSVPPQEIATTAITLEEQTRGRLAQLRNRKADLALAYTQLCKTTAYFCGLNILLFDTEAQRIFNQLRKTGVRIGTLDLRIAAIVLSYNATLVTRNQKDFQQVPALQIEDWS